MKGSSESGSSQRSAATAGALAAVAVVGRAHAAGSDALKVALVGCGGRGTGAVTQVLGTPGPIKLWAMADLFPDQIERSLAILTRGLSPRDSYEPKKNFDAERIAVPPERRFSGFDGYQKAIDCGADLVMLATPAGFRPLHYAAAVKAGKHVFLEKPCCVDAPGYRLLMEANRLAAEKDLKIAVGLQRRHSPAYQETIRRIHEGTLGELKYLRAYYNCDGTWLHRRRPGESEMEYQIRNYHYFVWLSGDLVVDGHIHSLDICNWIAQDHPVEAQGMGGRQSPVDVHHGQTFDHFTLEFTYRSGLKLFSQCRYVPGCWSQVGEMVHGLNGQATFLGWTGAERGASLSGPKPWKYRGAKFNPYEREQLSLISAIREGRKYHEGWYGATSSFTGVLGRMAAYSGHVVKWDDAVAKGPSEMPKRLTLDAEPPARPDAQGGYAAPIPGVTKAYD